MGRMSLWATADRFPLPRMEFRGLSGMRDPAETSMLSHRQGMVSWLPAKQEHWLGAQMAWSGKKLVDRQLPLLRRRSMPRGGTSSPESTERSLAAIVSRIL